jgi:cytochrome P450
LDSQILQGLENSDEAEKDPEMIALRLLSVNLAGVHTLTMTELNLLLDLLSSPIDRNYIESLREEAKIILDDEHGWTKRSVDRLVLLDSAVRESLRLSAFAGRGLLKKIVSKDGVHICGGLHIPHGINVSTPQYHSHHDESFYSCPDEYDVFRFVQSGQKITDTGASYLPFGHGRDAWLVICYCTTNKKPSLTTILLTVLVASLQHFN